MKTIIPVNKDFRIELDAQSWAIAKWEKSKKLDRFPEGGYYKQIRWYPTLLLTCQSLSQQFLVHSGLDGADKVINALSVLTERLSDAIEASDRCNLYADEHRRLRDV